MKVVILVGGYGSRLFEETISKPKPMIEIGGMPLIWHLMKIYSTYGLNDFILCMGYKQNLIVDYFRKNYTLKENSIKDKNYKNSLKFFNSVDKWNIELVDTGLETLTGGRIKKIKHLLNNKTFLLTYGDTLSNVNILKSIGFHKKNNAIVTLTTIQPRNNYGVIEFGEDGINVKGFREKPIEEGQWINGGFYVMEPEIINYICNDSTSLELKPFEKLVEMKKLAAFKHDDFWMSIETYKDKLVMEELWNANKAKWSIWKQNLKRAL